MDDIMNDVDCIMKCNVSLKNSLTILLRINAPRAMQNIERYLRDC